jgi:acyl-CoA reductase-like NAD-dependent aldehyde dehydrogenase
MATTMSQPARDEYLEKMRDRYRRYDGRLAKTKLLDEFCQITGHERKYANKLLKRLRGPNRKGGSRSKKRGRERIYALEVVGMVFEITPWISTAALRFRHANTTATA